MNKKIACIGILILTLANLSCAQKSATNPNIKTFSNGDVARVSSDNQITITNAKGEMIQQSTFSCSTFSQTKVQLQQFQTDLKTPKQFMARDIAYPLLWNHQGKHTTFKSAQALQAHFEAVFTPAVQQAITEQDPYLLFANANGTMIGSGQVWFCNTGIFTINA
jgi:hypothetical protein